MPTSSPLGTANSFGSNAAFPKENSSEFVDRRQNAAPANGVERRQFGNTHYGLSPEARELAEAIDNYKLKNRRRFVTYEEMLDVITQLGYVKQ